MHPNTVFDWTDREEMLAFVRDHAFAHIFAADGGANYVVHAPLVVRPEGHVQFHLSRRNRSASILEGRPVLISVLGRHAYQSANWYASENQVPTWHYEAVEIEGVPRLIAGDALVEHLDRLSATHEGRVQPDRPWTRSKMDQDKFAAMTKAVLAFEFAPTAVRGTRKFNQHKPADDLRATIAGQQLAGREDIVAAIAEVAGRP